MFKVKIPIDEDSYCSNSDVETNNKVSNYYPFCEEGVIALINITNYFDLGGFCIIFLSLGLKPRAVAGGPSVTRFTYCNYFSN